MTRATPITPELTVVDGHVTTTSLDVARHFGKRHDHVLRAIRDLLAQLPAERAPNFGETFVDVPGPNGATRSEPAYRITRDGFTLLAMGFTGARALEFKLAYLDAFNRMESELSRWQATLDPAAKSTRQALENAAQLAALVQAEAFEQFARSELFDGGRWLLTFVADERKPGQTRPHIKRIESDACIMSPERFLQALVEPNGIAVKPQLMTDFIAQAMTRLRRSLDYLESKAAGKPVKLQW